ncbi:hypothetical protein PQE72_gp170 [Bacillus phage vB_BanS_Skywalker]|uniref:Uncharacterized protein n=2 Tax=Tsamsavirus TaxID=3044849 RepID=A0AAE8YWM6_9CAUD|nr:hypothetical protein PQE72_gp170 [Bacillus phage vB_BanS_Skywalker]YP_010681048.1 hypothetical protein PQE73_gp152 [Bacillus phage vB_BanS_MrDarsey]UGO47984.1 hypothetical protein MRDARSEY_152 [Bacillus phage vB_BanS_MrDarsey]UGO51273.1 hypothetical protein SKYWALKER_116 [Bacillus phage vB_BanS_Skywalker]
MINFFKKLFSKGQVEEVKDAEVYRLIRYAREKNLAIVVGTQDRADEIKSIDSGIKIYRLAKGFTFELKDTQDNLLLDSSVAEDMIGWVKNGEFSYAEEWKEQ